MKDGKILVLWEDAFLLSDSALSPVRCVFSQLSASLASSGNANLAGVSAGVPWSSLMCDLIK